jgi:hypothetical protein
MITRSTRLQSLHDVPGERPRRRFETLLFAGVLSAMLASPALGQSPQGLPWPFTVIDEQNIGFLDSDIVPGDFNNDGYGDVVTISTTSDTAVYMNSGPPAFQFTASDASLGVNPHAIRAGDLDGDGNLDLVYGRDQRLSWRRGSGVGSFGVPVTISSGQLTYRTLNLADIDADGDLDIAAGGGEVIWYENDGSADPSFEKHPLGTTIHPNTLANRADLGDLNGDGLLDLASFPMVRFNTGLNGSELFGPWVEVYSSGAFFSLGDGNVTRLGDVNGDGRADMVGWKRNAGVDEDKLFVFYSPPVFDQPVAPSAAGRGYSHYGFDLALVDLDGDGAVEPVTSRTNPNFISTFWRRVNDQSWEQNILGPHDIVFSDVDGDGALDGFGHAAGVLSWLPNPGIRPYLVISGAQFADDGGDGAFQPGETGSLRVYLRRGERGTLPRATIVATAGVGGAIIGPVSRTVGPLPQDSTANLLFPIRIDDSFDCDSAVEFSIMAEWGGPGNAHAAYSGPIPLQPGSVGEFDAPLTTESPNLPIPDNSTAGLSRTLLVTAPSSAIATRVEVSVDIQHSYRGDLRVNLIPPHGDAIRLQTENPDDDADDLIATYSIGSLVGSSPAGTYTLVVSDRSLQDTGVLRSWSVDVSYLGPDCSAWQPPDDPPPIAFFGAGLGTLAFAPGDNVFTGDSFGWRGEDGVLAISLPAEPPTTLLTQNAGSWGAGGLADFTFFPGTLHAVRAGVGSSQAADSGASTRLRAETIHGSLDHVYNINDNQGGPHGPPIGGVKTYVAYFRPSDLDLNGQQIFAFDSTDDGNPFGSRRVVTLHGLEFGAQDAGEQFWSPNALLSHSNGGFGAWQYQNYGPLTLSNGEPIIEGGTGDLAGGVPRHLDDADPQSLAGGAAEWLYQPADALEATPGALYRATWSVGFDDGAGDDGQPPRGRLSARSRQAALSIETTLRGGGPIWPASASTGGVVEVEQWWTGHASSSALNGAVADDLIAAFGLFNFANGDPARDGALELRSILIEELAADDPNTP